MTAPIKERPILFSGPMVRALLNGSKTQTRRVCKNQPYSNGYKWDGNDILCHNDYLPPSAMLMDCGGRSLCTVSDMEGWTQECPYGQPGDRLWVRETWQYYDWNDIGEPSIRFQADNATTWPAPSNEDWADRLVDIWASLSRTENFSIDSRARDRRWRPSIHMPRWASRILLEIVSVRVERLNDCSEADALAEGATGGHGVIPSYYYNATASEHYSHIWESINGAGSWAVNPWVWVISFRRETP